MMNKDFTIDYYNNEANNFFESTVSVDFSRIQELFLQHIKPGGRVLDLGCGSGRDSHAFLERGYEVVAVDGSKELAKMASEYIGQDVIVADFREYEPEGTFDGIWACASLLHLPKEDIVPVMRKMGLHLAENGCFYVSFKYGTFAGERNGRYFTNMTEESFEELLEEVPGLAIEEFFVSEDVRPGRESERWLNVMMRKTDRPIEKIDNNMERFICGECLSEMKKMPDESIDFIFTSPPYADQIKDYGVTGMKIKPEKFDDWFIPRAKEMFRILKPTGSFVLNINDKLDGKFQSIFVFKLVVLLVEQVGFHLVRDYIWHNPATPPNVFSRGTMGRTKKSHEYCLWFSKSENWTFNMDPIRKPYGDRMLELFQAAPQGNRNVNSRPSRHNFDLSHPWKNKGGADPGSVLSISNTSSNDTFHRLCKQFGIGHPARFPEALAEFFIKAGTNKGDIVLDPFGGSGTTAIVAYRLGRDYKYIEINPEYHDMAQKWFEVEFSADAVYSKNMDRFCKEVLPICKWNLLPFGFLYDLYESWFPTVGLYEKPQTKKLFIEHLILSLKENDNWNIEEGFVIADNSNMPMPEPLIAKYKLKNWMNKDYQGDDIDMICSPTVQKKYKGICRNDKRTSNTEGIA